MVEQLNPDDSRSRGSQARPLRDRSGGQQVGAAGRGRSIIVSLPPALNRNLGVAISRCVPEEAYIHANPQLHAEPISSSSASSTRARRSGCHISAQKHISPSTSVIRTVGSAGRFSRLLSLRRRTPISVGSAARRRMKAEVVIGEVRPSAT